MESCFFKDGFCVFLCFILCLKEVQSSGHVRQIHRVTEVLVRLRENLLQNLKTTRQTRCCGAEQLNVQTGLCDDNLKFFCNSDYFVPPTLILVFIMTSSVVVKGSYWTSETQKQTRIRTILQLLSPDQTEPEFLSYWDQVNRSENPQTSEQTDK